METFLRRNFKVKGNVLALYKPLDTQYTKLIEGIEIQLWHKAPMAKIFLGKAFTDSSGDFAVEFEADSPANYIVDGKITDVFIEAYYNGQKLAEPDMPDLLKGLVAYWKLDETTGTIAADATGNGHIGALVEITPTWNAAKINNGLTFHGDSDGTTQSYVRVEYSNDFNFGTGDFTVALWAKINTTSADFISLFNTGTDNGGISLQFTDPNIFVIAQSAGTIYSKLFSVSYGTWTHIIVRRIGYQLDVLMNGVTLGKVSCDNSIITVNIPLVFGSIGDGSSRWNLDGMLDEIGIWKGHGLTDEEVALLYNNGTGRQYPFTNS